ncbi:MAG: ligase-associated DNA damage response endonuclease PdeM [Cyanobacteria bacterium P01_A01_bin.105]
MKTLLTQYAVDLLGQSVCLLPDKAIYLPRSGSLLVSDVHLGKAETFQALGVPVAGQVNTATLARLRQLCETWQPQQVFILGDLFHSPRSLVAEVTEAWQQFLAETPAKVTLIVGNHDQRLVSKLDVFEMGCQLEAVIQDDCVLSHEPVVDHRAGLNICGHVHPVVVLRSRLDRLRLPCFYLEKAQRCLTLPAFGGFTGGYEVELLPGTVAYVPSEDSVIPFEG